MFQGARVTPVLIKLAVNDLYPTFKIEKILAGNTPPTTDAELYRRTWCSILANTLSRVRS